LSPHDILGQGIRQRVGFAPLFQRAETIGKIPRITLRDERALIHQLLQVLIDCLARDAEFIGRKLGDILWMFLDFAYDKSAYGLAS
jgi:hypothetical protein